MTYDERLLEVSKMVPEFAGFHYDNSGNPVVSLQSAKASGVSAATLAKQLGATTNALTDVFWERYPKSRARFSRI